MNESANDSIPPKSPKCERYVPPAANDSIPPQGPLTLAGFDSSHFGDVIRSKKGLDSSNEKRPVFTGLFSLGEVFTLNGGLPTIDSSLLLKAYFGARLVAVEAQNHCHALGDLLALKMDGTTRRETEDLLERIKKAADEARAFITPYGDEILSELPEDVLTEVPGWRKQMPFFRIFKKEIFDGQELNDDQVGQLIDLTKQTTELLETELQLKGFWDNIPARNKLRASLQELILSRAFYKLPNLVQKRGEIISRIMETAERNNDTIILRDGDEPRI